MLGLIAASLRRRPARALLTATGIGVGVAAIVSLIALGDGLKQSASGFIHLGRADVGIFQKGVSDPTASVLPTSMAAQLERQPGVAEATPIQLLIEVIQHEPSAIVFGIDPSSLAGQRLVVTSGHRQTGPGEVILGDQFAKQANLRPGAWIQIKGKPYTVVGVFHSGVTFEDSGAVIGLRDAQVLAGHAGGSTTIAIALDRSAKAGPAVKEIERRFPGTVAINDP